MYATRERERILDLFEMVCGARLTVSYIRVGGVWKDLPPAFLENLEAFLSAMPGYIDEYEDMLTSGPLWRERLEGIGRLSREEVINMGLTGPMLRGSGVDWDLRRDMPYGGYENYDFVVPVSDERRLLRPLPGAHGRDAPEPAHHQTGGGQPARWPLQERGPQDQLAAAR